MKRTDSIFVEGLRLKARVGIYTQEKKGPQPIKINLRVTYIRSKTVDIKDVVSYEAVVVTLRRIAAIRHYDLLETLADKVIAEFFKISAISKVEIEISKPNLPKMAPKVFGGTDRVGISVIASR